MPELATEIEAADRERTDNEHDGTPARALGRKRTFPPVVDAEDAPPRMQEAMAAATAALFETSEA